MDRPTHPPQPSNTECYTSSACPLDCTCTECFYTYVRLFCICIYVSFFSPRFIEARSLIYFCCASSSVSIFSPPLLPHFVSQILEPFLLGRCMYSAILVQDCSDEFTKRMIYTGCQAVATENIAHTLNTELLRNKNPIMRNIFISSERFCAVLRRYISTFNIAHHFT
jgi:hypothetical protein